MASLFDIGGVGDLVDGFLGSTDGFKAGFILELRDSRKTVADDAVVFVMNPTRYELSEPFQTTLTPTEDNTVIPEETGIIVREITLEGTFGLTKKKASGWDVRQYGGQEKDGNEHFFALRNLFRKYSEKKKKPDGIWYSMIFYALKENERYRVVPNSISSPRDARQNRMHRIYRITMSAIDVADKKKARKSMHTDTFTDGLKDISEALGDARSFFAETTAHIARIKRKIQNINAIMIQAAQVITAVGNMVRSFRDLAIVLPMQLVATMASQIEAAADTFLDSISPLDREIDERDRYAGMAMMSLSNAFNRMLMYPELFSTPSKSRDLAVAGYEGELRLTRNDLDDSAGGAELGSKTRVVQGSARGGGLALGPLTGTKVVILVRGDSILSVANANSCTPELIILINDLRYPYISEAGGPGIMRPGDKILVPSAETDTDASALGATLDQYVSAEDALYGVDLALDRDLLASGQRMELKVDKAHGSLDAELVRGVPNVVQGVEIILNTDLTASQHVPDIGLRRSIGTKGTLNHLLLTANNLQEGILSDPRIEEIESIATVLDQDVLRQELRARLVTGRALTLGLPFGRASGSGSTVNR